MRVLVVLLSAIALNSCSSVETLSLQKSVKKVVQFLPLPFGDKQETDFGSTVIETEYAAQTTSLDAVLAPLPGTVRPVPVMLQPVAKADPVIVPEQEDSVFFLFEPVDSEELESMDQAYAGPMDFYAAQAAEDETQQVAFLEGE